MDSPSLSGMKKRQAPRVINGKGKEMEALDTSQRRTGILGAGDDLADAIAEYDRLVGSNA